MFVSKKRFERLVEEETWKRVNEERKEREMYERYERIERRISELEMELYSLKSKLDPDASFKEKI